MPRLTDYEPRWINKDGRAVGVSFACMAGHCHGRIRVLFANPIGGGPPYPDNEQHGGGPHRWQRTGETFDTLSLSPSIDAGVCGHFTVTNGGW